MRFIFRPPAAHAAGLLALPWDVPLEEWVDDRLLEVAHRGISRHVVRFVEVDGMVFALKEIDERLARREYQLLGRLEAMGMPDRVAERIERLNQLGFDVDELELRTTPEGTRLRVHTRVAEAGRDRRRLFALTGLEVTENQARRLLNDVVSFRGYLEQKEGRPVPETVAGHRWRSEIYDKVMAMVPEGLDDRLAPAEIFHEILEHRWFLSEQAGTDVGTTAAAQAYVERILPQIGSTLTVLPAPDPD